MNTKFFRISDSVKNPALISVWSIMHFWIGIQSAMLFKYYNLPDKTNLFISFILHTIYEFNDYYQTHISKKYKENTADSNSIINCIGDTIVNLFGTIIYLKFYKQKPSKNTLIISLIFTIILFHFLVYYYGGGWSWVYKQTIKKLYLS
tara:strand:- start:182 stop:625 length:444 start_codon:yes stop_codon:yes gene_type:complete